VRDWGHTIAVSKNGSVHFKGANQKKGDEGEMAKKKMEKASPSR